MPLASFTFSEKTKDNNFNAWHGVNVNSKFLSRRLIKKLHAQNKSVFAWTVNKKLKMKRLVYIGVDGIITNKPDMARAIILENK